MGPCCFGAWLLCWGWHCPSSIRNMWAVFTGHNDCWGWGHGHYCLGGQDHANWWDVSHTRPVAPPLETLLWCESIVLGNLKMFWVLHPGWCKAKSRAHRSQRTKTQLTPGLHLHIRLLIIGTSLVAQWLRIRLPMQGTRVQALVWDGPTCRRATKPVRHNYWACTLEPTSHNYGAHEPQLRSPSATTTEAHVLQPLKPACLEPVLRNKRSHRYEKPEHHNKE